MQFIQGFTAMIYREGDGYVALCPEMEIVSQGTSFEDATSNLEEAVELFFECAAVGEVSSRTATVAARRHDDP